VVNNLSALDTTFAALADPTRRDILHRLSAGSAPVTVLAEPYHMSLPAISKHLKVLERAGLIAREKMGRVHRCHLSPAPIRQAAEWLSFYQRFWERQLDALADFLESEPLQSESKETK